MQRLTLVSLFGALVLSVGGSVKAQCPVAGQPYQLPAGYEAYAAGTLINYGGFNYVTTENGTMLLAAQQEDNARPQSPVAGQAYQLPPGYEAYGPGTQINYGGYNYVSAGNGTMVMSSSYPQGNSADGYVRFQGANPGFGGSYQNAYGTSANGQFQANNGQFAYQNADGSQTGGQYQFDGQNGNVGGYGYDQNGNGYNGNLAWQGNNVQVQGEVRQPGYIPGTQDHIGGGVNYQGVNSSINGHYNVYDPTGHTQLAGVNGQLDRHRYNQGYSGGIGPVHGGMNEGVNFGGVNSQVYANQGGHVAGVGYGMGMDANIHGVHANSQVNIGGVQAGVGFGVDNHGVHVNSTLPPMNLPNVGHVSMPHYNLPNSSGHNSFLGVRY